MEEGRQSSLVGPAADAFARKSGVTVVSNDYFTTATKKACWESRAGKALEPSEDLETVGAVALDLHGNLAAASSAGGLTGMGHVFVESSGRVFLIAYCTSSSSASVVLWTTIHLLSQHTFY